MNDIQKYLLKMTQEIDTICTENGIEYVLFGGSSLGLERNEGFLPWDDDLDLLMTKKNYTKFVELMKNNPPEGRIIEGPEVNDRFPLHFAKYMSTETTGIIRSLGYGNSHAGIWVDIFYLCPLSRDPETAKNMLEWFQAYCEFQNRRFPEVPVYSEGLFEKYKEARMLSKEIGYEETLRWLEEKFDFVDEDDCDSYFLHHALTNQIKVYSKRHMEHIVRRPFEGVMLPFSATNRELSREAYGDNWMMVPSQSGQEVHDSIVDLNTPFEVYLNDYMQYLDTEKADNAMFIYKSAEIARKQSTHRPTKILAHLNATLKEMEYKKIIGSSDWKNDPEVADELYDSYENILRRAEYTVHNAVPSVDRDFYMFVMERMIREKGQWVRAERLLNASSFVSEEDRAYLGNLIDLSRRASVARYDLQDPEKIREVVLEMKDDENGILKEVNMAEIVLAYLDGDMEGMKALCDKYETVFEDCDTVLMAKAAYCQHKGDLEGAEELGEIIKETSNNGLILLDVNKKHYGF